jgi:hypothetical protein
MRSTIVARMAIAVRAKPDWLLGAAELAEEALESADTVGSTRLGLQVT